MKGSFVFMPLIGLASVVLMLGLLGFRVNLTTSLPLGVYRTTLEAPRRGSVVNVCLPPDAAEFARARRIPRSRVMPGWRPPAREGRACHHRGRRYAEPGQYLRERASGAEQRDGIGGQPWAALAALLIWRIHRLGADEFWLFSSYHRTAYDSRSFGPVKRPHVVSVLRPIWLRHGRLRRSNEMSSISRP